MSEKPSFTVEEVYYCVYFADGELAFPFIGSYVFLGFNMLGNEEELTHYFQDCESFARYGTFMNDDEAERQILGLTQDVANNMVTLEQMVPELQRANVRRANLRK